MVKLNNRKIAWIVKRVSSGEISTKDATTTYHREVPKLNPDRRPKTSLTMAGVEGMRSPL